MTRAHQAESDVRAESGTRRYRGPFVSVLVSFVVVRLDSVTAADGLVEHVAVAHNHS